MKDRLGGYISESTPPGISCTHICNPKCRETTTILLRRLTLALAFTYVRICVYVDVISKSWKYLVVNESRDCTIKTRVECIMRRLHERREDKRRSLSQIGCFPRRESSRLALPI